MRQDTQILSDCWVFSLISGLSFHPPLTHWRWTHGYVENVAAAITLATVDERAAGRVYNVGEEHTPTVRKRLRQLPPPRKSYDQSSGFFFDQSIVYDTSRIRGELGYREIVPYNEGIKRSLGIEPVLAGA